MQAWRLCRSPFVDLSGEGARFYGGRWNSPGRAVVYGAADAALTVLEVRVHLDIPPNLIPDDYVLERIELPNLPVETVSGLPGNPQEFGDRWLEQQRTPVLAVPSFIVPESVNLLLNPAHPQAKGAKVANIRPFSFDKRLWLPL